jgi:hypothetical protein
MKNKTEIPSLVNYFTELGAFNKALQNLGKINVESFNEALNPLLQHSAKIQNDLTKALSSLIIHQTRHLQQLTVPIDGQPFYSELNKFGKNIHFRINEVIAPSIDRMNKFFQELPPRTRKVLIQLGSHGWYFDLNMHLPELWELDRLINEGNVQEAEEFIAEYFEDKMDEIEKYLISRFPDRRKILESAFQAHRRKEYILSIPVFLAQTDGICKGTINKNIFMTRNKKMHVSAYVEQLAPGTLKSALFSPLAEKLPISVSESDRDANFNQLNRHMVIHGESLDYGSRINSLKSISLINYISQMVESSDDES